MDYSRDVDQIVSLTILHEAITFSIITTKSLTTPTLTLTITMEETIAAMTIEVSIDIEEKLVK